MVTLSKYGAKYNRNILFLEGLSTDTKPTGEFDGLSIQNGSEYTEVDTGKKFLFDYDNATWYEVQTGGGGGGGGTTNYNDLSNRPSVNNTLLTGNKTSAQLGLASSEQGGKADSAIQGVKLNSGSAITPDANNVVDITVGKADVGLGNVTNDAQVKKISSSTSGDIVTWSGTSGDTVADSGVSIETSITDSDLKIPTSKAVNTALSGKQATIDSSHKLSADLVDNSTPTFATATQGGKADTAVQTIKVNSASTGVTKTGDTVDITAIPASIVSAGALANGMTATTQTTSDDSTKVATTAFVHDVVDLLPSPMVYKGTLGTGGTKTTLPVDGTAEVGDTYKVITAGTYASQAAKIGDMFICLTKATSSNTWSYVPSGDDTDVTQVSAGTGLTTASGSPITTTGTIKAKLKSSTALAEAATNSTTSGKSYAVNVDSNGDLACNVPWTDTTYSAATTTTAGLMSAQDKTDLGNAKTNITTIVDQTTQYNVAYIYNAVASGITVSVSGYTATFSGTGSGTVEWGSFTATTTDFKLKYNVNSASLSFNIRDMTTGTQVQEYYVTSGDTIANLTLTVGHQYAIRTYSNSAVSGVIKISIIPADIYDAGFTDYQPYALPNAKIIPALIELVDSGAKNELHFTLSELQTWNSTAATGATWSGNVCTVNGIAFTVNSDGTITANGTLTSERALFRIMWNTPNVYGGKILSGCPSGGSTNDYGISIEQVASPWASIAQDYGNGSTIVNNTSVNIYGYIAVKKSVSNLTFKPMICSKSAWDESHKYVPYRPSYEETVEQVETNKTNISNVEKDTSLLKNTITTIRFASGVSRSWQFTQRTNYHIFMVFGFVQGVGLVYWICKIDNTGALKVYDALTNTEVTQSTISYSVADNIGTVTISSSVGQWSYLTIIKNAEIT